MQMLAAGEGEKDETKTEAMKGFKYMGKAEYRILVMGSYKKTPSPCSYDSRMCRPRWPRIFLHLFVRELFKKDAESGLCSLEKFCS